MFWSTEQVPPSEWQGVGPDGGNKPVVVHETSDNPGGGATGDATFLLQAMLQAGWASNEAAFGFIVDPGAYSHSAVADAVNLDID